MFDPGITVLVVDDMRTMRKLVIKSLKEMGYENVIEAEDGQKAWATLSENADKIKLVISDWNMPNCTGLDFLKRVRADSKLKNLPFLLLTAESEASQVKEALAAGVDNYAIKPFTTDTLKQKVGQIYTKRFAA